MTMIDTHVWVWFHLQPERLSRSTLDLLSDSKNPIMVSSMSAWEVALLLERKIFTVDEEPREMLTNWLSIRPMTVINPDIEIFCLARSLRFEHRDSADHIIAATAFKHQAPLITSDMKLQSLPWLQTIQA